MNKKRLVACLLTASILVSSAWNVCAVGPDTAAAGQVISYSALPYPTYVYNPTTLELPFGEALPEQFPTEVTAVMNDGSIGTVTVGKWTAIREFNAAEEGIYVYGANVVPVEGKYQVLEDSLTPNENPTDPSEQRTDYTYDVYYRIGYFKTGSSYNAYARSMENLDRGVYAVKSDDGVFISWRILATEYGEDISFDVYRNGIKINSSPITDRTNFTDAKGKAGDGGNRSARYNIAIGYLPKEAGSTETIPAVFFNRGYYAKTTIAAYTLRNGKLQLEWNFVALTGEDAADKGNHNVSTGDLDQDGFDEICIGNMAVDHDGSLLWVKNGKDGQDLGSHGDAIHLAAMNPNNPTQLYVFSPTEEYKVATVNQALSNAGTGLRYDGIWTSAKDVGRAVAANITPLPGYEYWGQANNSGVYNILSGMVNPSRAGLPANWVLYWDGDLLSELGDGVEKESCDFGVYKYNWESGAVDTIDVLDGKTNNSTKNNPSLTADILGDWREEVVLRNEDDTELRIYMTTTETDYMIYTLMHDPVYRNCVANQNSAYNQPPHIGFYLGEDNKEQVLSMNLPIANIVYTTESKEVGKSIGTLDYAGILALKKQQALDTLKGFFS